MLGWGKGGVEWDECSTVGLGGYRGVVEGVPWSGMDAVEREGGGGGGAVKWRMGVTVDGHECRTVCGVVQELWCGG